MFVIIYLNTFHMILPLTISNNDTVHKESEYELRAVSSKVV